MKSILFILILATSVIAMTQVQVAEKLKPARQEIPEQKNQLDKKDSGYREGDRGVCTRNNPEMSVREEFMHDIPYEYVAADGSRYMTKHCVKCRTGVYSYNQDENVKHCSFCGALEE